MLVHRVQRVILESTGNPDRVERKENGETPEEQVHLECEGLRDHQAHQEIGEQQAELVRWEVRGRVDRRVIKGQKATPEHKATLRSRAKRDSLVARENVGHQVEWVHPDDVEHRDHQELKDQMVYPAPLDPQGHPDPRDQRVQLEKMVKTERQEAMDRGALPVLVEMKELRDPLANLVKMVSGDSQDKMEHRETGATLAPLVLLV